MVIEKVHWRRMSIRLGLLSILILLSSCQTLVGGSGTYKPNMLIEAEMKGRTIHLQS